MKIRTALMTAVISGLFMGVLPAFAAADFDRGTNLYAKGQFQAASDAFIDAICAQPRFYPAHYALANSYMKLGKMEAAQTEYEMCLEMYPDASTKSKCQVALNYLNGTSTSGSAAAVSTSSPDELNRLNSTLAAEGERRAHSAETVASQKRLVLEQNATKAAVRYKDNAKAELESMKANARWWTTDRAAGKMVPVIPLGVEDAMFERAVKEGDYAMETAKAKGAEIKPSLGTTDATDGLRSQIYPTGTSGVRLSPKGTNIFVRNYETSQVAGKSGGSK